MAELLLTKLQIVTLNREDVLDALILLASHPLAADSDTAGEGSDALAASNVSLITALTSSDCDLRAELDILAAAIEAAIEAAPKPTRWRLRARVGDRVAWYEEPEEVGHGRG